MSYTGLVERLRGGKCPECKGWGEVAYFGETVACKCNGRYEAPITMATRNEAAARIEALEQALRIFIGCAYPVSTDLQPRGHNWRGETSLDYALSEAIAAMETPHADG